jgi:DNA-binding sugar fermentation-stimulating protein
MTTTNKFSEFTKLVEEMEGDFEKFYDKGVSAAGTRVRKHLQELAKLCKEGRNDVTAIKNARKEAK